MFNHIIFCCDDELVLFRSVFVHFRTLRRFKSFRGVQSGGPGKRKPKAKVCHETAIETNH